MINTNITGISNAYNDCIKQADEINIPAIPR